MSAGSGRFGDRRVVLESGAVGRDLEVPSAAPRNYWQAISQPELMPRLVIDGKLFLPPSAEPAAAPLPLVIVVPGSLGIAPSHLRHAGTLTSLGIAAFVLDPFGARSVTSTVANQTQYSFAASAWDVLAAYRVLAALPEIDTQRIGAQGHSRGGSAVLIAASRRFADAVLGAGAGLCAAFAAYPSCGHQFLDPRVGATEVRILIGDRDQWCSPAQAQSHWQAVRLTGGRISLRIVAGAQHSFDRGTKLEQVAAASVAPAAPVTYLADDGAYLHPLEQDTPNPELVDRDVLLYGVKAGYGARRSPRGCGA